MFAAERSVIGQCDTRSLEMRNLPEERGTEVLPGAPSTPAESARCDSMETPFALPLPSWQPGYAIPLCISYISHRMTWGHGRAVPHKFQHRKKRSGKPHLLTQKLHNRGTLCVLPCPPRHHTSSCQRPHQALQLYRPPWAFGYF